jgi:hypothetical protein
MAKFHDFLVEHAKFPFPLPDEFRTTVTTDVSDFEVGLLKREWKAKYAVRDDALVRKLCDSLQNILGDIALSADSEKDLLANFSPRLESDEYGEDEEWLTNPSKVQASFQRSYAIQALRLTPVIESVVIRKGCLQSRARVFVRIWPPSL